MGPARISKLIFFYSFFIKATVVCGHIYINNIKSTDYGQCIHGENDLACDFSGIQKNVYLENLEASPIRRVTITNANKLFFNATWYTNLELIECTAYFSNASIQKTFELKLINSNIDNIPEGVSEVIMQGSKVGQITNITSMKVVISQVRSLVFKSIDINYLRIQSSTIESLNIENVSVQKNAELSVVGSTIRCIEGDMLTSLGKQLKWENNHISSYENCGKDEKNITNTNATPTTTGKLVNCNVTPTISPRNDITLPVWMYAIAGAIFSIVFCYSLVVTVCYCKLRYKNYIHLSEPNRETKDAATSNFNSKDDIIFLKEMQPLHGNLSQEDSFRVSLISKEDL